MSIYVDSSALMKRYIAEPDSGLAETHLLSDPLIHTARHAEVEVRRNLARYLTGPHLLAAQRALRGDMQRISVIELDAETCERASSIAEITGVRTLDALHLGAAQRIGNAGMAFLTFDLRQAQAARGLGFTVLGA